MNTNLKKTLVALSAASLMIVGVASAQDTTVPATTPDTAAQVQDGRPPGQMGFYHDLILEYTGLDDAALRTAIENGSTLADLITANGKTVEDFTAAVLAEYDTHAAEARTNFQERLTAVLSGEGGQLDGGFGLGGGPRGGAPGQGGPRGQFGPPNGQGGRGGNDQGQGGAGGYNQPVQPGDATAVPPLTS